MVPPVRVAGIARVSVRILKANPSPPVAVAALRQRPPTWWAEAPGRTVQSTRKGRTVSAEVAPSGEFVLEGNLLDKERFVHSRGGFFGGDRVAYAPRQVFLTVGLTVWFQPTIEFLGGAVPLKNPGESGNRTILVP